MRDAPGKEGVIDASRKAPSSSPWDSDKRSFFACRRFQDLADLEPSSPFLFRAGRFAGQLGVPLGHAVDEDA
jgi:hypothetical protein